LPFDRYAALGSAASKVKVLPPGRIGGADHTHDVPPGMRLNGRGLMSGQLVNIWLPSRWLQS